MIRLLIICFLLVACGREESEAQVGLMPHITPDGQALLDTFKELYTKAGGNPADLEPLDRVVVFDYTTSEILSQQAGIPDVLGLCTHYKSGQITIQLADSIKKPNRIRQIAWHEIGHAIGWDHNAESPLMGPKASVFYADTKDIDQLLINEIQRRKK